MNEAITIGTSLMSHQLEFAAIITIQLGLMAGLVAHFDTMNMKDKQLTSSIKYVYKNKTLAQARADLDKAELYAGLK